MRIVHLLLVLFPLRAGAWEALEPGVELGEFKGPAASVGDGMIRVLRVDPARVELRLLNASAPAAQGGGKPRTARDWCAHTGAIAAINASMFLDDQRTSVGRMHTRTHVNHAVLTKDKALLAFDRLKAGGPAAQIIDRTCENLDELEPEYGTVVQSIRMVSCDRKNQWAPGEKRWSTTAIGIDGAGRVLFIHARSPWPVHDLVDALLALPIDLKRAMYTEGGPEAQLYVKAGGREREWIGSYETGFNENDDNTHAWEIPNVVAVVRKK
jgi:hypothetical protein